MSDATANNHKLLRLTIVGAVFMTLAGSAMHFVYDWSGQTTIVGLVGPVNESIWEHAKLVFWPPLLWYVFAALFLRRMHRYEVTGAAAAALWFMPAFQTAFYYLYAAITRGDLFFMDLVDFELTVILEQLLFYRPAVGLRCTTAGRVVGIVSVAALAGIFFALTFQPPHLPVFRDPQNGTYSLPR